ncbi:MAG TPA: hypothetical protein VFP29_06770 [Methyloceanibacter sp.]|nr:hypothetical protein [Methyloceanibacter sp.]
MRFKRRLTAAAGLAGMAFYAVLLPWHIVSQASLALAAPPQAMAAEHPCHGHDETVADEAVKGAKPTGKTHCPICTGLGILHLAVASAAIAFPAPPDRPAVAFDSTEDHLIEASVHSPRSRAPPRPTA